MTGTIWPQDGDTLTETTISRMMSYTHASDFVDKGCFMSADFQANTVDVGTGVAYISNGSRDTRQVIPNPGDGIPLPVTSGVNYIYIVADFTDDSGSGVQYQALDTDSPPNDTSLKIGEVDTASDTTTDFNRNVQIDTSNLDAATLDGFEASDFAVTNEPTVTQSLTISGASATLALGDVGDAGPHALLPGNDAGEQQSALTYRTNPDEWTFEIAATAERIMTIPTDLTSMPTIYGQEIRTLQDTNTQPNFTVGPDPPQNPEQDDVWIDTS